MNDAQNHCRNSIDAHFSGSIRPTEERRMRAHLPSCESCHRYYAQKLVVSKLDPTAIRAKERLARGLGLRLGTRRDKSGKWLSPLLAAAGLVLTIGAVSTLLSPTQLRFTARGSRDTLAARLLCYRIRPGAAPELVGSTIQAGDELAFAYQNYSDRDKLLVFGVDSEKRVFWFHPEWSSATERPQAIPVEQSSRPKELSEGITHAFKPGRLRIFGVFLREAMTVVEVERRIAGLSVDALELPLQDTVQTVQVVEVLP
jgi:hypothetical protein